MIIQTNIQEIVSTFKRVVHSMSKEDTRYYLCGAFIHIKNNAVYLVSTDGHQLTEAILKVDSFESVENEKYILSSDFINKIAKIKPTKRDASEIILNINHEGCIFEHPDTIIKGSIIDGNYPDYERCIPEKQEVDIGFSVDYMINLCKAIKGGGGDLIVLNTSIDGLRPATCSDNNGTKYVIMPRKL